MEFDKMVVAITRRNRALDDIQNKIDEFVKKGECRKAMPLYTKLRLIYNTPVSLFVDEQTVNRFAV